MSASPVWTIFTEVNHLCQQAKCKLCSQWYSFKKSTSGLLRHVRSVHGISIEDLKENRKQSEYGRRIDSSALREQQARMIVSCNLSFSTVENLEYRKLIEMCRDDFPLISADTCRSDIIKMEREYRQNIGIEFKNKNDLVLLSDGWQSNNANFQLYCLVAGYLGKDLKLKQQLIGCVDVPKATTTELHKLFIEELKRSGLSMHQFKYVVTDGGTNLKSLAEHIQSPRVHCAAHILHLVVCDLIKAGELAKVMEKGRQIAGKLNKSNKLKRKAKEKAAELQNHSALPQTYSPTRWNASRDLLMAIKSHMPTLISIAEFTDLMFSTREQNLIDFYIGLTKPIHDISTRFERTSASSSEIIPFFQLIKKNVMEICNKFIRENELDIKTLNIVQTVATKAEELLEARINIMKTSNVLKMCSYLDHRFSRTQALSVDEWENVEKSILEDFSDEPDVNDSYSVLSSEISSPDITNMNAFIKVGEKNNSGGSPRKRVEVEIVEYNRCIHEYKGKDIDDDPISFWRFKTKVFPHLSKMAFEYLSIPASSSSTERIFSGAGRIVSNRLRNRLSVETCTSLLMVQAMIGYEKLGDTHNDYGVIEEPLFSLDDEVNRPEQLFDNRVDFTELKTSFDAQLISYDSDGAEEAMAEENDCLPTTSDGIGDERNMFATPTRIPKVNMKHNLQISKRARKNAPRKH